MIEFCYRGSKQFAGLTACRSREESKLYAASTLFAMLSARFPVAKRGMKVNSFGKLLTSIGVERIYTMKGNMYKVVPVEKE